MTMILGLSGRKQSGKNTCLNYIVANTLVGLYLVDWAKVNEKGQLVVPTDNDEEGNIGILDVEHPATAAYLHEFVWPFVKNYSFATPLKNFCIRVFGLSYEQAYGSNADKDSPTALRWEDMPLPPRMVDEWLKNTQHDQRYLPLKRGGPMTAREVLQYFGTNICRQMLGNCWVDATIRKIQDEGSQFAIVTDVRFPNEVEGIQKAGGKVLRFTRGPFAGKDEHESERALDGFTGFDAILDNAEMSIPEQNDAVAKQLMDWGYVNWVIDTNTEEKQRS